MRIRELRLERALTQTELANKAAVTVAEISRIERDQVTPRPPTVRRIAEALGVEPQELFRAD